MADRFRGGLGPTEPFLALIRLCGACLQVWQAFYAQRWNLTAGLLGPCSNWQAVYSQKLQLAGHLYGSCSHDILKGHKQAARCLSLLPSQGLLASGGLQLIR